MEIIPYLPVFLVMLTLLWIWYRFKMQQKASAKAWDELAEMYPDDFLADDEWAFVAYKDEVFPMRVQQKRDRWNQWNAAQKREFYLAIKAMIKKGRGSWHTMEDGKRMYVDNKKKREVIVQHYQRVTKSFVHKFSKTPKQFVNANTKAHNFQRKH